MFKLDKKLSEPKWFKYPQDETVEILIRPISVYDFPILPNSQGEFDLTPPHLRTLCVNLIEDWKGVPGDQKCTTETKIRALNQNDLGFATWILKEATELKTINEKDGKEPDLKNLPKSPVGETPKSEKPVVKSV